MSDRAWIQPGPDRMPCRQCATWSEAGDRFCTFCGAALERPIPVGSARPRPQLVAAAGVIAALLLLGAAAVISRLGVPTAEATGSPASSSGASEGSSESSDSGEVTGLGRPFGTTSSVSDEACASGELECVRLVVPRDHADPDDETVEVRFGVHEADPDERSGTLVIATGGPGSSGIELSPGFIAALPDAVLDKYDVVFFEQRGVRRSAAIGCEEADAEMPGWSDLVTNDLADVGRVAAEWVDMCLAEAGIDDPSALDAYATFQAAADLDAYLDHIGAGAVMLYGESYGTDLVQTYAAHRPERVAGLILDAVVDPTIAAVEASIQQASAFSDLLDRVLDACVDDPFCADDFPGTTAARAWDELADRLREERIEVELPTRDGSLVTVPISRDDLIGTSGALLYTEHDRSMLLRILASSARGDLKPLARVSAILVGRDPETGRPLSTFYESSAGFYAVACQAFPADREGGLAQLHGETQRLAREGARMASLALSSLPCFGGFAGAADPLVVSTDTEVDYPMLVLTSEADPATPMSWAEAVAGRHGDAYLIVTSDGSHGSFGWGLACPDDIVKEFLVFGDLPENERTQCDGYLVDPYMPLPLDGVDAYPDVLEALVAVEQTLITMPDFVYWDGAARRLGCPHGGWMQMTWGGHQAFELHECQVLVGWPLSGSVDLLPNFTTTMELEVPNGNVTYESTETWQVTITGTIDGEPVDLSR